MRQQALIDLEGEIMRSSTKTILYAAIGTIVIIVTLAVFFIGFGGEAKSALDWASLAFTLFSELALFTCIIVVSMAKSSANQIVAGAGIVSTAFIYWVAVTFVSILGESIFKTNLRGFITTQIFLMSAAAIVSILLYMLSISVKAGDEKTVIAKQLLTGCEKAVFLLRETADLREYFLPLNRLYEEIKYSDKAAENSKDHVIYAKINELSEFMTNKNGDINTESVSERINEIILLIKDRNLMVRQTKQGGL